MSIGKMAPDIKAQFNEIERQFQQNDGDQDSQQLVLAISPTESQADTFEQENGLDNNENGEEIESQVMIDLENEAEDDQPGQYDKDAQDIIDDEDWGEMTKYTTTEEMTPERIDENAKNKIPCIKKAIETPKKPRKVAKRCIVYGKEKSSSKKKMSQDENPNCKCKSITTNLTNFSGTVEMRYTHSFEEFTLMFQSGTVDKSCMK